MDVRIKFLGAAHAVTGSKYLLEIDEYTVLIDCGLFQGYKELRLRNWDDLPIDVAVIDAVVLTHAHIDHSGYLPRLMRQGYSGTIHCTTGTADLLGLMLRDAAKLQEEEAEFAKKKGYSRHEHPQPLFTTEDAEAALSCVKGHPYSKMIQLSDQVNIRFNDAGHILGSSIVEMTIKGDQQTKKITFSGDLGGFDQPLMYDPVKIQDTDILLIESTYGDRLNAELDPLRELADFINTTFDKGGCVLIPAFAVGRTQLILYYIHELFKQGKISNCPVYLDSPMAISATGIYRNHPDMHKLGNRDPGELGIFDHPNFKYYRSQDSSLDINDIKHGAIIISASGMCTGGRVLHHLYHRLPRKEDTVLMVGYQAEGTRGRRILEGEDPIRIFGIDVPVECTVGYIKGLSAHADQSELLTWASAFNESPKMTFVIHGEEESSRVLAKKLEEDLGFNNVFIPEYLESFELFQGI